MIAAERVRAAAARLRDRDAAAEREVERLAAERDRAENVRDSARARAEHAFAERLAAGRDAVAVASDAARRAERAAEIGQADVADFRAAHAPRADVAHARLDVLLAGSPPSLGAAVAGLAGRLCDEVRGAGVDEVLRVLGLAALHDRATAARDLHELLDAHGSFSPLTSARLDEWVTTARVHLAAVRAAAGDAADQARRAGEAFGSLDAGNDRADPAPAAAAALDANEKAQSALGELRRALDPTEDQ